MPPDSKNRPASWSDAVLAASLDAILAIDHRGRITEFNEAAVRLFGYTREEVIGQRMSELIVPQELREGHEAGMRRIVETGNPKILDQRLRLPAIGADDRRLTVELIVTRIGDSDPPSFLGFIRDVSDLVRTEHELREARDAAEAANRAKTDFLAIVSHEIRTPMNAILGLTELSLEGATSAEQRGLLETVYTNGRALLTLINDILDVSRIEAGELRLTTRAFSVADVLESVVEALGPRAYDKGVPLTTSLDLGSAVARVGDADRIRQILLNLVGNAVKFTSEGSIVVSAETELDGLDPNVVRLTVRDTGIGMSEEAVERIFDSFYQADVSMTRKFGGTGLGLSITRSLVEALGGSISVDSELGRGTEFRVDLPIERRGQPFPKRRLSDRDYSHVDCLVLGGEAEVVQRLPGLLAHMGVSPEVFDEVGPLLRRIVQQPETRGLVVAVDHLVGLLELERVADTIQQMRAGSRVQLCALVPPGPRARWVHGRALATAYLTKPLTRRKLALPLARTGGEATDTRRVPGRETHRHSPRSVLVVEDNQPNQVFIERLLSLAGHVVDLADDGRQGFERWKADRYDVVLTDLEMPNVDGLQLAQLIREHEAATGRSRTPIVAVTAHAVEGFRERCLEAGMDGYLTKPVMREELLAAVETVGSPAVRVLIVEDDDASALIAQRALARFPGIETRVAPTGRDAIALASEEWDLVLCDLELPDRSGHQVVEEIRPRIGAVPVWAVTAHDVADVRDFCIARGFAGVLGKPLNSEVLAPLLEGRDSPTTRDAEIETEVHIPGEPILVDPVTADLVPGYLDGIRRRIEDVENTDLDALRILGHDLKGTGRGYGFAELSRLGQILEEAARDQDAPQAKASLGALADWVREVRWEKAPES